MPVVVQSCRSADRTLCRKAAEPTCGSRQKTGERKQATRGGVRRLMQGLEEERAGADGAS